MFIWAFFPCHCNFINLYLFVRLSTCLYVRPSVVYLSVCLSVSMCVFLSIRPSIVCLSVCLTVRVSICLSVRLTFRVSIYLSIVCPSVPTFCLSVC